MPGKMDCFGLTDRGLRRTSNEDHFLIADLNKALRDFAPDEVREGFHVEHQEMRKRLVHGIECGECFISTPQRHQCEVPHVVDAFRFVFDHALVVPEHETRVGRAHANPWPSALRRI